jgi:hypothetical protein
LREKEANSSVVVNNPETQPKEHSSDQLRLYPQLERKVSKRREVQEERVIVMDLFK